MAMKQINSNSRRGQLMAMLWSLQRTVDMYPSDLGGVNFVSYKEALVCELYRKRLCALGKDLKNVILQKLAQSLSTADPGGSLIERGDVQERLSKIKALYRYVLREFRRSKAVYGQV